MSSKLGCSIELGGYTTHILGFTSGIKNFTNNVFGAGFGIAGNYSISSVNEVIGAESAFGSLIGQFGIFYLFLLIVLFFFLLSLYNKYKKSGDYIFYALYSSLFLWIMIHFFSESALGFSGNIFYFIFSGLGLGVKDGKK